MVKGMFYHFFYNRISIPTIALELLGHIDVVIQAELVYCTFVGYKDD